MKVILTLCLAVLTCLPAAADAGSPKTFYDHIKDSWAFGEIKALEPMKYRDGLVLAFPARISELIHARYGKPRSILLIHQLEKLGDPVPFAKDVPFVAPLRVLPRTKYWRENLPNSPRHEVLGSPRYVFKDDDAGAAKQLGKQWSETLEMDMPDRKLLQGEIVTAALSSKVDVLSEDSVRFLSGRTLTHINAKSSAAMVAFAAGDAPEERRVAIIDAIGRAQLKDAIEGLEELAKRKDATGAAALRALAALGTEWDTAELLAFAKEDSSDIRAWAFGELGAAAGTDEAALAAAAEVLASEQPAQVRIAAAKGLGRSGADAALAPLRVAVERGDLASRPAAMALAEIGSEAAVAALKDVVNDGPNEAMIGSVMALVEVSKPCADCRPFLMQQYETHEEAAIRDLIAIVLQLGEEQDPHHGHNH